MPLGKILGREPRLDSPSSISLNHPKSKLALLLQALSKINAQIGKGSTLDDKLRNMFLGSIFVLDGI